MAEREDADSGLTAPGAHRLASAERVKTFADAVVAIAMTLLILPLLETVSQAASDQLTTFEWVDRNGGALFAFVLSFAIIANFWVSHHRLFAEIDLVTGPLLWLTIGWMITIVWLPVPTAMTGLMHADPFQRVLYIGAMALTSIMLLMTRIYVHRHPELHDIPAAALRRGLAADIVTAALFGVCLTTAILVPDLGYGAMFLMFLVAPLHALVMRVVDGPKPQRSKETSPPN